MNGLNVNIKNEQTRLNYADKTDKAPVIDAVRAGYYKVLGKGVLPKQPVIVKAKFFSRLADSCWWLKHIFPHKIITELKNSTKLYKTLANQCMHCSHCSKGIKALMP